MKDSISLHLGEEGQVIVNGAQGITGTPHDANFTIGILKCRKLRQQQRQSEVQ